ncbi:class I SAM-dependent methyltransferase [Rhodococcus sp. 05-339-2]|uniref:class I SAM-dependent methyltransferase n=1 Tax=Rhodococcoides fascians TaxID=1828 RepID=UPI0009E924B2|nr:MULTISPECIES: class I SAM-dependent methyltransferase [Rhodococcus]OZD82142.1 class I SAM-dependent methyltransferase [Rhodococcus sp. 05-339-2]
MTNHVSRRTHGKSEQSIAKEWDRLAFRRSNDIRAGTDLSYLHVLSPTVFSLLGGRLHEQADVLDIGCGTGNLTVELAKYAQRAVGIDPSGGSLDLAMKIGAESDNCEWSNQTVQQYSESPESRQRFDVLVANMVLMDTLDLKGTLHAIHELGKPGASFVWTITHPAFWPSYWGYDRASWYDYNAEIQIESEFRSSAGSTGVRTTHVHRPLSTYLNAFADHNLLPEEIIEPTPVRSMVPTDYIDTWKFPRFLGGRCRIQ